MTQDANSKTIARLIYESVVQDKIATAEYAAPLAAELRLVSDDYVEAAAQDLYDYWGVDDDGDAWRVALLVAEPEPEPDEFDDDDTHNRPQNDEQLWDMVFGAATPRIVSAEADAQRPGLLEYCEDSLAAARDQGLDLADYDGDAVDALVRMATIPGES